MIINQFNFFRLNSLRRQNNSSLSIIFILMVLLLSFVGSCTFFFAKGFYNWQNSHSCKITVEIPVAKNTITRMPFNSGSQNLSNQTQQNDSMQKANRLIKFAQTIRGFKKTSFVPADKLHSFITNWTGMTPQDFTLPILIDIEFSPSADLTGGIMKLQEQFPDILIERHDVWLEKLAFMGQGLEIVSLSIGGFLLLCLIVIITLLTKSLLQNHSQTLDILRLMGARNNYIASIFQTYMVKKALKGSILGFCCALPVCFFLFLTLAYFGLNGMTWQRAAWPILGILLSILVAVTLLSLVTSRVVVLLRLRKLDA